MICLLFVGFNQINNLNIHPPFNRSSWQKYDGPEALIDINGRRMVSSDDVDDMHVINIPYESEIYIIFTVRINF